MLPRYALQRGSSQSGLISKSTDAAVVNLLLRWASGTGVRSCYPGGATSRACFSSKASSTRPRASKRGRPLSPPSGSKDAASAPPIPSWQPNPTAEASTATETASGSSKGGASMGEAAEAGPSKGKGRKKEKKGTPQGDEAPPSNVLMTAKQAAAASATFSLTHTKVKLSPKALKSISKSISQNVAAAVMARRGAGRDAHKTARKAAWMARRLSKPLSRGAVLPEVGEVEQNADGSVTRWVVSPKRLTRPEIHLKQYDKVVMPPNLPMIPELTALLPLGLGERGLVVSSPSLGLAAELDLPQHSNPKLPGRPDRINDLFSVLLHAPDPEMRLRAVEQLRWIRTKLSVSESEAVLSSTMEHFGWKAGLKYLDRMAEASHCELQLRHYNVVLAKCTKPNSEGGARQVAAASKHVVDALVGQGLVPNLHTIHLLLQAGAREGDLFVTENAMRLAKAYAINPDIRSLEFACEAFAKADVLDKAKALLEAMVAKQHWPQLHVLAALVQAMVRGGQGLQDLDWIHKVPNPQHRVELQREAVRRLTENSRADEAQVLLLSVLGPSSSTAPARVPPALLSQSRRSISPTFAHNHAPTGAHATAHATDVRGDRELMHKVVTSLLQEGDHAAAVKTLLDLHSAGHPPVLPLYRAVLKSCVAHHTPHHALPLIAHMDRHRLFSRPPTPPPDQAAFDIELRQDAASLQSYAITALAESGHREEAMRRFARLPDPDVFCLHAALRAMRGDKARQGPKVREAMLRVLQHAATKGVSPDDLTYNLLIRACHPPPPPAGGPLYYNPTNKASSTSSLNHWPSALYLYEEMGLRGLPFSPFSTASLLSVLGRGGQWRQALDLLEKVPIEKRDVVMYNAALDGLAVGGQWRRAGTLFEEMQHHGLHPTIVSYTATMSACANHVHALPKGHKGRSPHLSVSVTATNVPEWRESETASNAPLGPPPSPISDGPPLQTLTLKEEAREAAQACLALLARLEDAAGFGEAAMMIGEGPTAGEAEAEAAARAQEDGNVPGASTAEAAGAGEVQGRGQGSEEIVQEMKGPLYGGGEGGGLPPPCLYSYVTAMLACGRAGMLDKAMSLFRDHLPRAGLEPTLIAYNTLLSCCAYASQPKPALALLKEMHGLQDDQPHLRPDGATYGAALLACAKGAAVGMRDEVGAAAAEQLLKDMKTHGLRPTLAHYKHVLNALAQPCPLRKGRGARALRLMQELLEAGREAEELKPGRGCWAWLGKACSADPDRRMTQAYQAMWAQVHGDKEAGHRRAEGRHDTAPSARHVHRPILGTGSERAAVAKEQA